MTLDFYIYFDGECRQAVDFYSGIFGVKPNRCLTYGATPDLADVADCDKDRVLYTSLVIGGSRIRFSDCPSGALYVEGTNVNLVLEIDDGAEVDRVFAALSDGGEVDMPLCETFFSKRYGMVTDKFGVTWHVGLKAVES